MGKGFLHFIIKISIITFIIVSLPLCTYARQGDCGYEGGISQGESPGKATLEYKEVCFLTGEPIVFNGTLLIKKAIKEDANGLHSVLTTTYTYNLKNSVKSATLARVFVYSTDVSKKATGQTVEQTTLIGKPSEAIKIGDKTFTMSNYDITRTNFIDSKPSINYFAGNLLGKKTYTVGTGSGTSSNSDSKDSESISLEISSEFYGFSQYWSMVETQNINYIIKSEKKSDSKLEKWGGTATINLSGSIEKQMKYFENKPDTISFEGGYVEIQNNNSILDYSAKLPEFDLNGNSTDNIIDYKDTLKVESFPVNKRLFVPDTNHIKGHWAKKDIDILYSLEVFDEDVNTINPEQYITRAEFIQAIVNAAKEVPKDPLLSNNKSNKKTINQKNESLPFSDIFKENTFYPKIQEAYKRGLISGKGTSTFEPSETLIFSEAIVVLIKALGLNNLSPNSNAVTTFNDNNIIPDYARNSIYVAQKIELIHGDGLGYVRPLDKLTKGRAAALINRFIDYMRTGIKKDYRDRLVKY